MKLLKKIMSMLFVVALAFSMITNVTVINAAGSDTATITVTGIVQDSTTDVKVYAYQVIELDSTSESGYKLVDWVKNAGLTIADFENPTTAEIDAISYYIYNHETELASYKKEMTLNSLTGDYTLTVGTSAPNGAGMYVIVTDNTSTDYTAMAASVGITKENDGSLTYDLSEATIDVTGKSSTIDIDKSSSVSDNTDSRDLEVGDTVNFEISTEIPKYANTDSSFVSNISFIVTDTLSEGLTYKDDMKITVGTLTIDSDFTFTDNDGNTLSYNDIVTKSNNTDGTTTITVNLSKIAQKITPESIDQNTQETIPAYYTYAGQTVTITYSATLNENAETGFDPNTNTANLTYTNTLGEDKTYTDTTYHYTFEIDGHIWGTKTGQEIEKVGKEGTSTTTASLGGAVFELYSDENCTNKVEFLDYVVVDTSDDSVFTTTTNMKGYYTYASGVYSEITTDTYFDSSVTYYELQKVTSTTSTSDGTIHIAGLDAGTYYLKEVTAPDGYSLNSTPVKIVISASYDSTTGKLLSYTISIGDTDATKYTATYTADDSGAITDVDTSTTGTYLFQNTTVSELPSTGGMGTMVFTVVGCSLMIIAAVAFLVSRRRKEEKE